MLQMESNLMINKNRWVELIVLSYLFGFGVCYNNGDLRLVSGLTSAEGRVEIFYNGRWGTVCDDSWGIEEATVVCQQLGFGQALDYFPNGNSPFGQGTGDIWLDDLYCTGVETRLDYCPHSGWGTHNCGHGEDAGVRCSADVATVRLVDGGSAYRGRVEVYYNDEWATICDNSFDVSDGNVICRQLGYDGASEVFSSAYFGEGDGSILSLFCRDFQSELEWTDCNYLDTGLICSHSEDAGLSCSGDSSPRSGSVAGIVSAIVIIFLIGICCCFICAAVIKRSAGRQQRQGTTGTVIQLSPPHTEATSNVTNQISVDDNPPSYRDVVSSPMVYPPQGTQSNPAYPIQNYPQPTYPPQPAVGYYPPQMGVAPYPPQTGVAPYPPQTGVAPYPPQTGVAPYPPQSAVAPYPPQSAVAPYNTCPPAQTCPPQQGNPAVPQSEQINNITPTAPVIPPGQPEYTTHIPSTTTETASDVMFGGSPSV